MQGSHELVVLRVEVAYFVFEETDQFQGGKSHDEVLNTPFLVEFTELVFAIDNLRVDVAA